MSMVPSGHKTLVHYPEGTSKVITLHVRPLEGQIIAHGWEVTNVTPGRTMAPRGLIEYQSRSHARRIRFRCPRAELVLV